MKSVKRQKKSWIEDYKGIRHKDIINKNKISASEDKSETLRIANREVHDLYFYPITESKYLIVNYRLVPHFKGLKRKSKDYHFEFVSITSENVSEW